MNIVGVRDFLQGEAQRARGAVEHLCPEHNETKELMWRAQVYDKLAGACGDFGLTRQMDMIREAVEVFCKDTWSRAMLRGETVSVLALAADIRAIRDF